MLGMKLLCGYRCHPLAEQTPVAIPPLTPSCPTATGEDEDTGGIQQDPWMGAGFDTKHVLNHICYSTNSTFFL